MSRNSNRLRGLLAGAALAALLGSASAQTPNPPGGGGSGSGGITQLTGDVTAGPGSGSIAATVVNLSSVTNASVANAALAHPTVTVAGVSCTLGSTCALASTNLSDTASIARSSNNLGFFSATTSAQLAGVISDETGTGALVFGTAPTITLTNGTGLPIASGVSGLGAGVATFLGTPSSANLAAALTDETGTGAAVFATAPTITLGNATGLPVSTGITGFGTGVATFLATPTSANLAAALTNETGTGAAVFAGGPALTGAVTDSGSLAIGGCTIGSLALCTTGGATITGQLIAGGTTTNDSAAAGNIGQVISSFVAQGSAVALTTGVVTNTTSISLTAGDWDVSADQCFTGNTTTLVTTLQGSISTASSTLSVPSEGDMIIPSSQALFNAFAGGYYCFSVGTTRISLATTTSVYLTTKAVFSTSTASAFGYIQARRER